MQQNQKSLEEQGKDCLWYTKALLLKHRKSVKDLFTIYKVKDANSYLQNDDNIQLNYMEFEKLLKQVYPQVDSQVVGYLFNLGDFQKSGQITLLGFEQLIAIIDMEKDTPLAIKKQKIEKQNYITLIKKLAIIKENHQKGRIDMNNIVKDLPIVVSYKVFFDYMQKNWNLLLLELEQLEMTKLLDKQFKKQIEPAQFLKFMGIEYNLPPPQKQPFNFNQALKNPKNNKIKKPLIKTQNKSINDYQHLLKQESSFKDMEFKNMDKYQQLQKQVFSSQQKFTDKDFPADNSSIQLENKEYKKYRWLRPEQFFKGDYSLFQKMDDVIMQSRIGLSDGWGEYITPYDIIQGGLGDCYFLSSLSCLAVSPERILNLFANIQTNSQGFYGVRICRDGIWEIIWIDDLFPCHNDYDEPAFTKGNGNELWVLILEKAWAKIWGNYGAIESGLCREALRSLTGAPTKIERCYKKNYEGESVVEEKNNNLVNIIEDALNPQNQFIVCAGSSQGERGITESTQNRMGLVSGHAYSIIKILHINHPQKGNVTLLKMRNPWAKKEWKGKWSDQSDLWTSQLKEQHNIVLRDDGIFYMEMDDFYRYFNDIEICYYHKNYQYISIPIKSNKKHSVYTTFKVQQTGQYYITVNQQSSRKFKQKYTNYKQSNSRIILIQLGNNQQFISAKQLDDRETYIDVNLEKNETYLLIIKTEWIFFQDFEFVLSSYGVGKVNFQIQQKEPFKHILQEVMLQRVHNEFQHKIKPYSTDNMIKKAYEFIIEEGIGFYYIKNESNKLFESEINFEKMKGLKQRKPQRGQHIKICLPPGEEAISILTVSNTGYSFSVKESYTLNNI